MPRNIEDVAKIARMRTESILATEAEKMLYLGKHYPLPRKNTRMDNVLCAIYEVFEKYTDKPGSTPFVEAELFRFLRDPTQEGGYHCSPRTLVKARRVLGIKSFPRNGKWYWSFPQRPPREGMEKLHADRVKDLRQNDLAILHQTRRPAAQTLLEVMKKYNYDVPGNIVLKEVGYNRQTVIKIKSVLGILSMKSQDDHMIHWIYAAPEVQDWLIDLLKDGPVAFREIANQASLKDWTVDLLRYTKIVVGGIESIFENQVHYWGLL